MNQDFSKATIIISFFYQWLGKEWACDPDLANETEDVCWVLMGKVSFPGKRYRISNSLFWCFSVGLRTRRLEFWQPFYIWVNKHKYEKPTCWTGPGDDEIDLVVPLIQPYKWLLDFLVINKKCDMGGPLKWLFSYSLYIPCPNRACFTYTLLTWLTFLCTCPKPQLITAYQRGGEWLAPLLVSLVTMSPPEVNSSITDNSPFPSWGAKTATVSCLPCTAHGGVSPQDLASDV